MHILNLVVQTNKVISIKTQIKVLLYSLKFLQHGSQSADLQKTTFDVIQYTWNYSLFYRLIAQSVFFSSHLRRLLLLCRQVPFPFPREVAFYHLPKIIVEKISIITMSMAYLTILPGWWSEATLIKRDENISNKSVHSTEKTNKSQGLHFYPVVII